MPRVLVPLAQGFEEIEAVTVIDVLRRAGLEVIVAGLSASPVTGSHAIAIETDVELDAVLAETYDLIVLPGGLPGATNLEAHSGLLELIQEQAESGRWLGAICAAPLVLATAGVLQFHAATSYPGVLSGDELDYQEQPVVVDRNIVTSRGPSTALRFSLTLVEQLLGPEKRRELESKMLVDVHGAS